MERAAADIEAWRSTSDPSRITIGIAPHAPYSCHPELFRRVAEYAAGRHARRDPPRRKRRGVPVREVRLLDARHRRARQLRRRRPGMAADRREPRALRAAVGAVRRAQHHGGALHAGRRRATSRYSPTTTSPSRTVRAARPSWGWATAPIEKFLRAGIRVGLGTDSPAASNSMDVFEEMRIGLLVQRATLGEHHFMNARQFVKMATLDAARALRHRRSPRLARARQAGRPHRRRPLEVAPDPDALSLQHARPHRQPGEHPGDDGRRRDRLRGPRVGHRRPRAGVLTRRGDADEAPRLGVPRSGADAVRSRGLSRLVHDRSGFRVSWRASCCSDGASRRVSSANASAILREVQAGSGRARTAPVRNTRRIARERPRLLLR